MIPLNDGDIIESFNEVIPHVAAQSETYLRAVAQAVQQYEPPVTMSIDIMAPSRAIGIAAKTQCLVIEPTARRLRHYKTLHYGSALGASLRAGWFLIGGHRAEGIFASSGIGAATDYDVAEVMSIVQLVHDYAVLPAIQQIADSAQLDGGGRNPGGFFGV